jgi:hypothetical protein
MDAVLPGVAAFPPDGLVEVGDAEDVHQFETGIVFDAPDEVIGCRVAIGAGGVMFELELLAMRKDGRSTAFAAFLPSGNVAAASTQRTTTPENICQGCECKRSFNVIWSSPASANSWSSLPKVRVE